jgi:hypothetical protein
VKVSGARKRREAVRRGKGEGEGEGRRRRGRKKERKKTKRNPLAAGSNP